eukprot:Nitzschia sp. Nitz4//scaffold101_size76361//74273//75368//NITZ4_005619-RA/size76361-snap-gene-0.8-mRNA-1//1//CDS//3329532209//4127//frame0
MTIDEPFEYLSFGRTFSRVFAIWTDRMDFFTAIAGAILVPWAVLLITVSFTMAYWILEAETIPDFHPRHIPLVVFVFGLQYFLFALVTILGESAASIGVARMYVGQRPTIVECFQEAWSKKYALFGAAVIIGLAAFVALAVVAIIGGIAVVKPNLFTVLLATLVGLAVAIGGSYAAIGVSMTTAAISAEGISSPMQALHRSWELASGSRCYLLCALFCLWFANDLVTRLLHNIFITGDTLDVMFSFAGIMVSLMPILFYFPLSAILKTVLYLNLRIGRESMNHQVLSSDLLKDASSLATRFRNDGNTTSESVGSMDYRHVPLMDSEEVNFAPMADSDNMA